MEIQRVVRWASAVVVATVCVAIQPMSAQISRVGSVASVFSSRAANFSPMKGSDSAYDPGNNVFLVVATCYNTNTCPSGLGNVFGIFVNNAGAPVGSAFSIGSGDAHFPRARYSAHVNGGQGGFLVVWSREGAAGANLIRTRVVAYNTSTGGGTLVGAENTINGILGNFGNSLSYAWLEGAVSVAYSPVSQRFLLTWRTYPHAPLGGFAAARLVDINGAGVGSIVRLSAGFGRDPSAAWNSDTNQFGVGFGNENGAGSAGYMAFAVVSPADASFTRESYSQIAGFTYITDLDYNPDTQRYVMTWHQQPGGRPQVMSAEIAPNGAMVTSGLVTSRFPGYDALSLARNAATGTIKLVSLADDALGSDDIAGVELNTRGFRTSDIVVLGPNVGGKYPRISSSTVESRWNVTFSDGFQAIKTFATNSTSTNGGPAGSYSGGGEGGSTPTPTPTSTPTPTPTPTSTPGGCTTPQPVSGWVCVSGDWRPPSTTPTPTPTSTPTPTPTPTSTPTGCTTVKPVSDWVCVGGDWRPPSSTPAPTPTPTSTPTPTPTSTPAPSSCVTVKPVSDWVCVNGDWRPPSSTPAPTPTPTPTSTPTPTPTPPASTCTTPRPGADWTCSNGNWLPPGAGPAPTPTPTPTPTPGTCTTPMPGAGWTCVNGGWLPPTPGSCLTPQPGPNWTCVNGDWKPPSEPQADPDPSSAPEQPWVEAVSAAYAIEAVNDAVTSEAWSRTRDSRWS